MTRSVQQISSGFMGMTCKLNIDMPNTACYDGNSVSFISTTKNITLRTVMAIHDVNDTWQIKETIQQTRYEMLAQFYSMLKMYVGK